MYYAGECARGISEYSRDPIETADYKVDRLRGFVKTHGPWSNWGSVGICGT